MFRFFLLGLIFLLNSNLAAESIFFNSNSSSKSPAKPQAPAVTSPIPPPGNVLSPQDYLNKVTTESKKTNSDFQQNLKDKLSHVSSPAVPQQSAPTPQQGQSTPPQAQDIFGTTAAPPEQTASPAESKPQELGFPAQNAQGLQNSPVNSQPQIVPGLAPKNPSIYTGFGSGTTGSPAVPGPGPGPAPKPSGGWNIKY